jgi:DNA-binding beta-propeller fold protein YncE
VSVISGWTGRVTATVTVPGHPVGIAVNPLTGEVYTEDNSGITASVITPWEP